MVNSRFKLMLEDRVVADVVIHDDRVMMCRCYTDTPYSQLFNPRRHNTFEDVMAVLKSRCWDEGRPDMDKLLQGVGLKEYNPLEIVKVTHGVSFNDMFWFKFEDEDISWGDVNPRKAS